jgi:transposase
MTQYVGLDVSLKETKLHVLDEAGNRVWRGRCATEPAAIAAAVRRYAPTAARVGLETGPLFGRRSRRRAYQWSVLMRVTPRGRST